MPRKRKIVVRYSRGFEKELRKSPIKVIKAFKKRRELFLINPTHPQLHNHALSGKYKGMKSINVTGDWRAFYVEHKHNNKPVIEFVAIGTHSQLFK